MDVQKLLEKLDADGLDKTASVGVASEDDPMVKLAADIFAGGQLFARGFIAELNKVAAEGGRVPTSQGAPEEDKSNWKGVAGAISKRHSMPGQPGSSAIASSGTGGVTQKKVPGDNPNVTYESVQPPQKDNPMPHETHGNVKTK